LLFTFFPVSGIRQHDEAETVTDTCEYETFFRSLILKMPRFVERNRPLLSLRFEFGYIYLNGFDIVISHVQLTGRCCSERREVLRNHDRTLKQRLALAFVPLHFMVFAFFLLSKNAWKKLLSEVLLKGDCTFLY